jgi:hypothetical protein
LAKRQPRAIVVGERDELAVKDGARRRCGERVEQITEPRGEAGAVS